VERLKGSSIGQTPALPTNIRLGWKILPRTNTLAYYDNSLIMAVKSFITLGHRTIGWMTLDFVLYSGNSVLSRKRKKREEEEDYGERCRTYEPGKP
jgi:hypothetical protein